MTTTLLYQHLSDADLSAKISELAEKYEKAISGGTVVVAAGENRRLEYTRANADGLNGLLRAAIREQQSRAGVQVSGAIPVNFGYGGHY